MIPNVGEMVYIQSYKHNGSLHRTWSKGYVLKSTEELWVVVTHKTWVSEADGRSWFTREPAICFFYPNKWYNIISMIRKSGIFYYCNIASPSVYDGESIKNIDYDLDIKVFPDHSWTMLDEDEFLLHQKQMQYSMDLIEIVKKAAEKLIEEIAIEKGPFDQNIIEDLFQEYMRNLKRVSG